MTFYERHILPGLIDLACGAPQIARQRAAIVPAASGRVVEIGIGTGHNLPFYDPARVRELIGVDPAGEMLAKARKRAAGLPFPVRMEALDGESLPFADASADSIVVTCALCTIPDPARALVEMHRVLKPGGNLLFIEHGAAPDAAVATWQDRLERWFWPRLAGGCHLTRRPDRLIAAAGFQFDRLETMYLPNTPKPLGFTYRGMAKKG